MSRPRRNRIERFRERLEWIIHTLPLEAGEEGLVLTLSELWDRICKRMDDARHAPNPRTWSRYLSQGTPDEYVIATLRQLYPDLRSGQRDLLTCPWPMFQEESLAAQEVFERWLRATKLFSASRAVVERYGKLLYADMDELHDLPLIGRRDWVSDRPVRLTAEGATDGLQSRAVHDQSHAVELPLEGLSYPYHVLKFQSLHRRRHARFNGDSYLVKEVKRKGDDLMISLGRGKYFDYLSTCEAHAALLSDLINQGIAPEDRDAADRIFARSGWSRAQLLNWNSRASFLGVNCLLIVHDREEPSRFYLHRRSTKTIEAQDVWHVVPSGGHQPLNPLFPEVEERIWHTAVRELLEELFGRDELANHNVLHTDHFVREKRTKEIYKSVVESGAAQFYFVGLGLDPATTKPESLCVIVLDWSKASEEYQKLAYRSLRDEFKPNWEGSIRPIALSIEALVDNAACPRRGETMLPAGAACLLLAARYHEHFGF